MFAIWCPLWLAYAVVVIGLSHRWGFDYRGGLWPSGRSILAGQNPYPVPVAEHLLATGNALITPPLLSLANLPFSLLPYTAAIVAWDAVQLAALVMAMRLCGVRDWRGYALSIASLPFAMTLALGQADGLFALAAAAAWHYRKTIWSPIAVGVLVAAKLFAWPLILWFVLTRRFRHALVSSAVAVVVFVLSWAPLAFRGFMSYPRLLSADAHGFVLRSHAIVTFLVREGMHWRSASLLASGTAVAVSAALAWRARRSDVGLFAAMILLGLLLSPVLWSHYLVLLLVPLAIARPRPDIAWVVFALCWISPTEPVGNPLSILFVLLVACFVTASTVKTETAAVSTPTIRTSRRPRITLPSART